MPAIGTSSSARWPRAATPAGLASTTTTAAAVLDAAGFDLVLIETVGTGQSEVEVAAAADTTVVLEAPEMGDEVQAIKAGLLEVADLVVVNKGDKPGALRTAAQLRAMLVPTVARTPDRSTDTEAPRGHGHHGLDGRRRARAPGGARPAPDDRSRRTRAVARGGPGRRRRSGPSWASGCARRWSHRNGSASTEAILEDVAAHRLDPYAAADRLLKELGAG